MAKGNFSVRTNSEWNSLTYKFRESRNSKQLSVTLENIKIPKGSWDSKLKKVKKDSKINSIDINLKIKEFDLYIMTSYNKFKLANKPIDKEWLMLNYYNFFSIENPNKVDEISSYLTDFIEFYIQKNITNISQNTIKGYKSTCNILAEFEQNEKIKLNFNSFNSQTFEMFIKFCNNKKYASTTIGTFVNKIKAIFKKADEYNLKVNNDYFKNKFIYKINNKEDIYLNEEDIRKIRELKLEMFSMYDNARDWLLIGLYTGQRVSDLFNLESAILENDVLIHKNIKTSKDVYIPVSPKLKQILSKYDGGFPRKISDVKFNKYIKSVCKSAEINDIVKGYKTCLIDNKGKKIRRKIEGNYQKWELVTSHTCRRTLITKLMDEPMVKPHQIMSMTGHTDVRMLNRYNKIEKEKSALSLKDFI